MTTATLLALLFTALAVALLLAMASKLAVSAGKWIGDTTSAVATWATTPIQSTGAARGGARAGYTAVRPSPVRPAAVGTAPATGTGATAPTPAPAPPAPAPTPAMTASAARNAQRAARIAHRAGWAGGVAAGVGVTAIKQGPRGAASGYRRARKGPAAPTPTPGPTTPPQPTTTTGPTTPQPATPTAPSATVGSSAAPAGPTPAPGYRLTPSGWIEITPDGGRREITAPAEISYIMTTRDPTPAGYHHRPGQTAPQPGSRPTTPAPGVTFVEPAAPTGPAATIHPFRTPKENDVPYQIPGDIGDLSTLIGVMTDVLKELGAGDELSAELNALAGLADDSTHLSEKFSRDLGEDAMKATVSYQENAAIVSQSLRGLLAGITGMVRAADAVRTEASTTRGAA